MCEGGLTCLWVCHQDQGLTNGIEAADRSERWRQVGGGGERERETGRELGNEREGEREV